MSASGLSLSGGLQATDTEQPTEERHWIRIAFAVDIAIVFAVWALLVLGSQGYRIVPINQIVAVGVALMLVAFVTFGGFYLASPATATSRDPWMRNAIAASFVMFYLFLLTLLLTAAPFRDVLLGLAASAPGQQTPIDPQTSAGAAAFIEKMFDGFSTFLGIVLGFYFATQAAERITETIQSGQTTRTAIQQQPDLAAQVLVEQQRAIRRGGPLM